MVPSDPRPRSHDAAGSAARRKEDRRASLRGARRQDEGLRRRGQRRPVGEAREGVAADAVRALEALGYAANDAEKAVRTALENTSARGAGGRMLFDAALAVTSKNIRDGWERASPAVVGWALPVQGSGLAALGCWLSDNGDGTGRGAENRSTGPVAFYPTTPLPRAHNSERCTERRQPATVFASATNPSRHMRFRSPASAPTFAEMSRAGNHHPRSPQRRIRSRTLRSGPRRSPSSSARAR